jgi:hypothetical protein
MLDATHQYNVGMASPLIVAIGGEAREDLYQITAGDAPSQYKEGGNSFPGFLNTDASIHSRKNYAGYIDFALAPIESLQLDIAGRAAHYTDFAERLWTLGFTEDDTEGGPLCRWVRAQIILDVMPLDDGILGFSNRWYKAAVESSVTRRISTELEIRIVTAPYFLATKLEAFRGRGEGDFLGSHDLEDLASVVDGRETLPSEVRAERHELRTYIRREIRSLLAARGFIDALPGYLLPDAASQSRISVVLKRLEDLASIETES